MKASSCHFYVLVDCCSNSKSQTLEAIKSYCKNNQASVFLRKDLIIEDNYAPSTNKQSQPRQPPQHQPLQKYQPKSSNVIEEAPVLQESVVSEEIKKEEKPPKAVAEQPAKKSVPQTPKALDEVEFAKSIMESLRIWQEQQQE